MRKKGKPNPDQRYFYLIVGLHAHTSDQVNYQVVAYASERIIVRASNPGQFESEGSSGGFEHTWQRGATPDSVCHVGRVGINNDRPDEALVVQGNVKVTGHIVQPSDARAKQNVHELDTREQLKNVQQLRVVRYRYAPEFSQHLGLGIGTHEDTGVIAQEVKQILPEAVLPAGDIVLPNGQRIDNFLVVNKERIFMENIGAVKELCKVTDSLETRIDQLEKINERLVKLKRGDSLKSSVSSVSNLSSSKYSSINAKTYMKSRSKTFEKNEELLSSNKLIQIIIVILILIMAFCLVAMATLHFLEYQKRNSMEWTYMADSSSIFEVGSLHLNNLQSSLRLKAESHSMTRSTSVPYLRYCTHLSTLFEHKSVKNYSPYTQPSTIKQHLHLQKIAWYPINHPGSPPKIDKKIFVMTRELANILNFCYISTVNVKNKQIGRVTSCT